MRKDGSWFDRLVDKASINKTRLAVVHCLAEHADAALPGGAVGWQVKHSMSQNNGT